MEESPSGKRKGAGKPGGRCWLARESFSKQSLAVGFDIRTSSANNRRST